MMSVM